MAEVAPSASPKLESSPAPPPSSAAQDTSTTATNEVKEDGDKDTEMENGTGKPLDACLSRVVSNLPLMQPLFLSLLVVPVVLDADDKKEELPEGASEVLYINNLNERIKLDSAFRFSLSSLPFR